MENLKIILPALIALVGTLVVAFLTYRQWRRTHDLTRAGGVLADKQAAYKVIWRKLEDVHLFVRSQRFDRQKYLELVRKVNIEMMRSGLLLEKGEARLANEYLDAMEAYATSLDEHEESSVRQQVQDTMYTTGQLPEDLLQSATKLRDAYMKLDEKRELVLQRFRRAIGADAI